MYLGIDGMRIVIDRKKESINEILSDEQIKGFSFFRQPIHVGTRKIHSSVTLEAQQDIKAMRRHRCYAFNA